MRELKGFQMDQNVAPAFHPPSVDALKLPTAVYSRRQQIKNIFVSIDPACGGSYSKFAIVSAIYVGDDRSTMVVRFFATLLISATAASTRPACQTCTDA